MASFHPRPYPPPFFLIYIAVLLALIVTSLGGPAPASNVAADEQPSPIIGTRGASVVAKEAQQGWNLAGSSTLHTQPETALAGVAAQSGLNTAPVMFIENVGQFDSQTHFQMRSTEGVVFLAPEGIAVTLLEPLHSVRDQLHGASPPF